MASTYKMGKEGLIDHLIVSERGLGGFTFPLKPFRRITESSGCELYFGEEAICSDHDLTPEEDRLLAEGKISEKDLHRRRRLSLKEYSQRALNGIVKEQMESIYSTIQTTERHSSF